MGPASAGLLPFDPTSYLAIRARARGGRAEQPRPPQADQLSTGTTVLDAEDAAREFTNLPLEDTLQGLHLDFEQGSPKPEPAARVARALSQRRHAGLARRRDVTRSMRNESLVALNSGALERSLSTALHPSVSAVWT